jgi:hypothetical protein
LEFGTYLEFGTWNLELGTYLEFGTWNLEFVFFMFRHKIKI